MPQKIFQRVDKERGNKMLWDVQFSARELHKEKTLKLVILRSSDIPGLLSKSDHFRVTFNTTVRIRTTGLMTDN